MSQNTTVHIRLVVPRNRPLPGQVDLVEAVRAYFRLQGLQLPCNERLLTLPLSVPALFQGNVPRETYQRFLAEFPHVDALCVSTLPGEALLQVAA